MPPVTEAEKATACPRIVVVGEALALAVRTGLTVIVSEAEEAVTPEASVTLSQAWSAPGAV